MRAYPASNGTRAPRWRAAPADIRLGRGEVHVWLVDLDGDPPAAGRPAMLEDALSADERARASRLRSEPLRRRFVAGRIAMRSILGRYPGAGAPRDLQFAYGPHGRPSLVERNGPHFNFTRSGPLALCAVARTPAVGVDVECVRAIPEAASITRQYFSAREQASLASLDMPPESAVFQQAFYDAWTRKEAFIKALQHQDQLQDAFTKNGIRGFQLQSLSGIDHIGGGQAVVQPPRCRPHALSDVGGKRNDIMARIQLDLANAVDIEFRLGAQLNGSLFGNNAMLGQYIRGRQLHLQPGAKLALVRPDLAHLRAGIARDHSVKFLPENTSLP